jgi:hypothetical protein
MILGDLFLITTSIATIKKLIAHKARRRDYTRHDPISIYTYGKATAGG